MYRCDRRIGHAPPFTHRITHRRFGGHHGEGSDAQQQRKEEAEAGQEQEERRRSILTVRRHAQLGQTRHLVHEPIRQEALANDHRARPQRAPYRFTGNRAKKRVLPIPGSTLSALHRMSSPIPSKPETPSSLLVFTSLNRSGFAQSIAVPSRRAGAVHSIRSGHRLNKNRCPLYPSKPALIDAVEKSTSSHHAGSVSASPEFPGV